MGAGIMQLLFYGQQDIYLKSNPSMTFFKKVFKTHTNFAMESIRVDFNKSETNVYNKTILKAKLPRHADLIAQIYLVFEIPEIVSDNIQAFRWVDNIGEAIIDNYYITIGGSIIDKQYGEFLHIQNSLYFNSDKRDAFNKMSGNVDQLNNPEVYFLRGSTLSDPPLRYRIGSGYPGYVAYNPDNPALYKPSIPSRKLYIPLMFWFNKDVGNALPLISLQYSEVELTIELRPWVELYKVLYNKNGRVGFYAPNLYIQSHHLKHFISNVKSRFLLSDTVVDCKCHLEANYIYLDDVERQYFAYKPLDYLIEQVTKLEFRNVKENYIANMTLQNPIKEIIWLLKRNDLRLTNKWFDFQDSYMQIMKTAKIMFNGIDRIEEKDAEYYNYLQPFQHHTGNAKEGLYLYSFAISPEEYQPTGSVNASRINNIQFYLKTKTPDDDSYSYDLTFYVLSYNFLRISSGLAGIVYSS